MRFNKIFFATSPAMASTFPSHTACQNNHLQVDVYHAPPVPITYQNTKIDYSPEAFTLIHSAHEAVLVDAPTLNKTAQDIASWITQTLGPGKHLKYIYITHGHFDHFGSFPVYLEKFPGVQVVATAGVRKHMETQFEPSLWDQFWTALFGSLTKPDLNSVTVLPTDGKFHLEGDKHELRAVPVQEGDTADSTVLHVPELDLVVGGDVIYGHCYQYIAENPTPELRAEWIASLERIKKLKPKVVVPSHMQEDEGYGVKHLDETQEYIRTWETLVEKADSWQELEKLAREKYPNRIGDFILRYTAQAFKP